MEQSSNKGHKVENRTKGLNFMQWAFLTFNYCLIESRAEQDKLYHCSVSKRLHIVHDTVKSLLGRV